MFGFFIAFVFRFVVASPFSGLFFALANPTSFVYFFYFKVVEMVVFLRDSFFYFVVFLKALRRIFEMRSKHLNLNYCLFAGSIFRAAVVIVIFVLFYVFIWVASNFLMNLFFGFGECLHHPFVRRTKLGEKYICWKSKRNEIATGVRANIFDLRRNILLGYMLGECVCAFFFVVLVQCQQIEIAGWHCANSKRWGY